MRYRIWPYRQGSRGALALAAALRGRVMRREGSTFRSREGDVVINWGDVNPPAFVTHNRTNIREASNKLLFFRKMRDSGLSDLIPEFWENRDDIPPEAFPIVCRTVLAGHSGDGIVISDDAASLVDARLFVKYQKKQEEYRVHVGVKQTLVGGDDHSENNNGFAPTAIVIAVQRKARRNDTPDGDVNWKIRNHANGFVFVRGGVNPHSDVIDAAKRAVIAAGLDFGGCDVIWNAQKQRAYVLEINTACGLEGQTIADYAAFFKGSNGETA